MSDKLTVLLKPVGDVPILKNKKVNIDINKDIAFFTVAVRKLLALPLDKSLFFFVNQTFAPSPDHTFEKIIDNIKDEETDFDEFIEPDDNAQTSSEGSYEQAMVATHNEAPHMKIVDTLKEDVTEYDDPEQQTSTADEQTKDYDKRMVAADHEVSSSLLAGVDETEYAPQCVVCARGESLKTRLFRWPKNDAVRLKWALFFRLEALASPDHDLLICSFHFSAETFIMVGEKVFWKASAMPIYRLRRPCVSTPFPWEQEPEPKVEVAKPDLVHYKLKFRLPYARRKDKVQHPVAVISPAHTPNIFYEFSFNRQSKDGQRKFYYCLNCKKAKTQSNIRDVVKTIQMDSARIISKTDPFQGHHFACRPNTIMDTRISSWQDVNCPQTSSNGQIIFCEENEVDVQWEDVAYPAPEEDQEAPILVPEPVGEPSSPLPVIKPTALRKTKKLKCHICPAIFRTTTRFVAHLQSHLDAEPECSICRKRISVDAHSRYRKSRKCKRCTRQCNRQRLCE